MRTSERDEYKVNSRSRIELTIVLCVALFLRVVFHVTNIQYEHCTGLRTVALNSEDEGSRFLRKVALSLKNYMPPHTGRLSSCSRVAYRKATDRLQF